ncbi:MAG: DNA-processing protein DprA [Clostridia bacterium]|nr:DNA-processing protein DprA [Clostridia bacterium]
MDSRLYWIWLQQALPLGCTIMGELLDRFGHAEALYRADKTALRDGGISDKYVKRLADKSLDTARRILDRTLEQGGWVLTPEDALYPLSLRQSTGCPAALYCCGSMPNLDSIPAVAVVGTRSASAAGMREAYSLSAGLAAGGMVVVSGGAKGIDAAAHTGALDGQGRTIMVMACPLDVNYPKENDALRKRTLAEGGLLLSEYAVGEPYRCDFHIRNRLLAGLAQGVCLGETPTRSGALISARLAREQGRDVFAMPGSLTGHLYDGAHREIQRGATLVMRATDILREYAPLFPGMLDLEAAEETQKKLEHVTPRAEKAAKPRRDKKTVSVPPVQPSAPAPSAIIPDTASEAAKRVFAALTDTPRPVDELAGEVDLPIPNLLAALTELEMLGCAENSAGQQYKKQ